MKSRSSLVAFAATVLLHLGLLVAVLYGLAESPERTVRQPPVTIRLAQQATNTPELPAPAASPVAPPQREKKRIDKKPLLTPKSEAAPRETTTSAAATPATAHESKLPTSAAPTASPPASTQTHVASPPIAQPTQPTRTSASEAVYASSNRPPPYPRLSRINEEEGRVVLRVLVKADGTAGAVEVLASSGYPLLDESARATVQTWRFKPATIDGKPVAEWYQVPIPFKLQNN